MVKATKNIDERCLPGTRRSHDGDPLAGFHIETYPIQSTDFIEALFEIFDLDQRRHHSPRKISAGRIRPSSRKGSAPIRATPTVKTIVTGKTTGRGEMGT